MYTPSTKSITAAFAAAAFTCATLSISIAPAILADTMAPPATTTTSFTANPVQAPSPSLKQEAA